MATAHQELGERGEKAVLKHADCPRCNRARHFKRLPQNFDCADVICKFCGFLAQVKTARLAEGSQDFPPKIPGAGWKPLHERMIAGIYHGLYVVGFKQNGKTLVRIDFVPPHVLQATPAVFEPRKPLSPTARRAGWTGHMLNISKLPPIGMMRVYPA